MEMEGSKDNDVVMLVDRLEEASTLPHKGKSIKRVCDLFNSDEKVVSWKFNEWDYGKNNIKLPCNARGLFILDSPNPRIVARGYDKFFSIDEVPFTKWDYLSANTIGPYEVSVKANGCIIFISALEDGTLVVCSKHSTGPRDDSDRNHAEAGERFLKEQLKGMNIDPLVFGKELSDRNLTAVTEYCDDSFEEHILEYTKADAGLYLHGLNVNSITFDTLPMKEVDDFSAKYGFKQVKYITKPDIYSLRLFLEDCDKTGSFDNEEIEGFVIRSRITSDNSVFFFKYKFEEPYLMYRQWREATKYYIQGRTRAFKFKKHRFITNKYLDFVIPILESDPTLCDEYMKGLGIINLRNKFLESYGMNGIEILNHEKVKELELRNALDFSKVDEKTKFLIVPIAVIGCGKTTTAMTINNLFPNSWGHVQNDDITAKDRSQLMKKSLKLLANENIKCVFVDRNNHQYRERKEILAWLEELKEDYLPYDTNIKVIAISYANYDDMDVIRRLTIERVRKRGDNHQSIKSSNYGEKKVLGIMDGFIKRFQEVQEDRSPDNLFDYVIHVHVRETESSLLNTKSILKSIHEKYPVLVPSIPTDEEVSIAFNKALAYKPSIVKTFGNPPGNKNKNKVNNNNNESKKKIFILYFSADMENRSIITDLFKDDKVLSSLSEFDMQMIEKLFNENKFQSEFHITLAHVGSCKKGSPGEKNIWQEYSNRYMPLVKKYLKSMNKDSHEQHTVIKTEDTLSFSIKQLCWDDKIIAATVQLEAFADSNGTSLPTLKCANKVPHITLGIIEEGTKPFYSNELCANITSGTIKSNMRSVEISNSKVYNANVSIHL